MHVTFLALAAPEDKGETYLKWIVNKIMRAVQTHNTLGSLLVHDAINLRALVRTSGTRFVDQSNIKTGKVRSVLLNMFAPGDVGSSLRISRLCHRSSASPSTMWSPFRPCRSLAPQSRDTKVASHGPTQHTPHVHLGLRAEHAA